MGMISGLFLIGMIGLVSIEEITNIRFVFNGNVIGFVFNGNDIRFILDGNDRFDEH